MSCIRLSPTRSTELKQARDRLFNYCYLRYKALRTQAALQRDKNLGSANKQFENILGAAKKWWTLQESLNLGVVALLPPTSDSWFGRLNYTDLEVFIQIVRLRNPDAVRYGEILSSRVQCGYFRQPLPSIKLMLERVSGLNPYLQELDWLFQEVDISPHLDPEDDHQYPALEEGLALSYHSENPYIPQTIQDSWDNGIDPINWSTIITGQQ